MLKFYCKNVNPKGKNTGDCSIRALAACLDISWDEALKLLYEKAIKTKYEPADRRTMGKVLEDFGYVKMKQPKKEDGTKYVIWDLDKVIPFKNRKNGVVVNVRNHYVCVKDDYFIDTWLCGNCVAGNYWIKP